MSDVSQSRPQAVLRRWLPAVVLVLAFVAVSVAVIPRMQAEGSARLTTYDLGAGQPTPGLRLRGPVERSVDGFVVRGFSTASVAFTAEGPAPRAGERTVLLLTAGAPSAETRLVLVDSLRRRHTLGPIPRWQAHRLDVTALARAGPVRVELKTTNRTPRPLLFADQVKVASYPPSATPRASRWEVAGWAFLGVLFAVAALGRTRRDALLPIAVALTAFLVWPAVKGGLLEPLSSDLWEPAAEAKWLDLDQGLLSGTFGHRSHLAVQLFHTVTPLTGTGVVGARTASMLVGLAAVIAIYALGRRVAGGVGAIAAVTCALLTDTFRLSLSSGDATGTLVLAASIFLVAVHRALRGADREAMAWLGAAGALAILAEAMWWPGVVAATVLVAYRGAPRGMARRAVLTAAVVLALVSLPSRVSVAHQTGGDVNGDVVERATRARNAEFVGRGHGAPPDRKFLADDPGSGSRVGLAEYVFGEHPLTVVVGGTLSGAYDGLSAAAERPESKLPGLIGRWVGLLGVAFLLLVPRLRLLVVVPALVTVVPWFFASREAVPAFLAGTAFWPALLVGAAALAYAAREGVRRHFETHPSAAFGRLAALVRRPSALTRRLSRRGQSVGS